MTLDEIQTRCLGFLEQRLSADPAHDITHVKRVVNNTLYLTDIEQANPVISVPAAWLHDCVSVAKDSELRAQASRLAADEARSFLHAEGFPEEHLDDVHHAIEAHSFSAKIAPRTLEARIVQDADRLEALGAIGIARCLQTGGSLGTALYEHSDPFCEARDPDERQFTIDHFYQKLFKLPDTMQTKAGKIEAQKRADYMRNYLERLKAEISAGFREPPTHA